VSASPLTPRAVRSVAPTLIHGAGRRARPWASACPLSSRRACGGCLPADAGSTRPRRTAAAEASQIPRAGVSRARAPLQRSVDSDRVARGTFRLRALPARRGPGAPSRRVSAALVPALAICGGSIVWLADAATSFARRPQRPPPRCHSTQLRLTVGVFREAMNQYGQTLVLMNISQMACTISGYPTMQPVGAGGRALHIPVRRGSGYTFLDHGPMLVTLLPGGRASFAFGGPAWDLVDDTSCLKVIAVRVIPPGDHTPLITPVHAVGCREGITVSALGPGRDSTSPRQRRRRPLASSSASCSHPGQPRHSATSPRHRNRSRRADVQHASAQYSVCTLALDRR
jgi:uncharacterized protein DUF4232